MRLLHRVGWILALLALLAVVFVALRGAPASSPPPPPARTPSTSDDGATWGAMAARALADGNLGAAGRFSEKGVELQDPISRGVQAVLADSPGYAEAWSIRLASPPNALAVSGDVVLCARRGGVDIVSLDGGESRGSIPWAPGVEVTAVAALKDAVALGGEDGLVRLLQSDGFRPSAEWNLGAPIAQLALAPRGVFASTRAGRLFRMEGATPTEVTTKAGSALQLVGDAESVWVLAGNSPGTVTPVRVWPRLELAKPTPRFGEREAPVAATGAGRVVFAVGASLYTVGAEGAQPFAREIASLAIGRGGETWVGLSNGWLHVGGLKPLYPEGAEEQRALHPLDVLVSSEGGVIVRTGTGDVRRLTHTAPEPANRRCGESHRGARSPLSRTPCLQLPALHDPARNLAGAAVRAAVGTTAHDVAIAPDDEHVADLQHGTWRLFATRFDKQVAEGKGPATALAFSPDGQRLAVGQENGSVEIVNAASGEVEVSLEIFKGPVRAVAWSQSGQTLFAGGGGIGLSACGIATRQCAPVAEHLVAEVSALATSPDDGTLAIGGRLGVLVLVNPNAWEPLLVAPIVGGAVEALEFREGDVWVRTSGGDVRVVKSTAVVGAGGPTDAGR